MCFGKGRGFPFFYLHRVPYGQTQFKKPPSMGLIRSLAQGHFSGADVLTFTVLQRDGRADEVGTNLSCSVIKLQHNN